MLLGVSSYAFGWRVGVPGHPPPTPYDELTLLAYAREHGLGVVQFGDHVSLPTFEPARLEKLRHSAEHGPERIELEIGGRGLTAPHLARYIAIARVLGARLLRFVVDSPGYEPAPAEITHLLSEAVPELERAGLTLGIENHDRLDARTLRAIMEHVGHPRVGICLDTANSLGAGEGLEHVVEQLGPHTVNLHLKDFAITRLPHAMGFLIEGRPAGRGRLDVPALRSRLAHHGRCRTAILETWTPPESRLVDTLVKEREWADASLAFLKPLFPRP